MENQIRVRDSIEDIKKEEEELRKKKQDLEAQLKHQREEEQMKKFQEDYERKITEKYKEALEKSTKDKEKVGHHYYSDGETISWEDTFQDEQDDIRKKIYDIEIDFEWFWNKFMFASQVMLNMSMGFFDQGRSFDKGFKILEEEFMLTSILSPQTIQFLGDEKRAMMQNWNINLGYDIAERHLKERWHNLITNINLSEFLWHYIQLELLIMFTLPGKFSLMSPMITAMTPALVSGDLILIQFVAGFTFFKYYAHGNIMMIVSVMWTMIQWLGMYFLLWNWDIYLYDLRIIRFMSMIGAIIFMIIYLLALGIELDLVFLEGQVYKTDNVVELILALIIGELLLYYSPTALVNTIIILKELTLNQFAWRKKDDYVEGEVFSSFNMDLFSWLGFDENIYHHLIWLAGWTHQFI